MTEHVWDKFLTERDKAVFAAGGFGARAGFGKRPALLIIDVNWLFCGDRPEPILESIKRFRSSCGEESWVAVEHIRRLAEAARTKGLPVIYTTNRYRAGDNWDAGSWRWKNRRRDEDRARPQTNFDPSEIVAPIAPGPTGYRDRQAEAVGVLRHEHGVVPDAARDATAWSSRARRPRAACARRRWMRSA